MVSIIPGMEKTEPERTETSNGFVGSPSFLPIFSSRRASASKVWTFNYRMEWFFQLHSNALHACVEIVKP